MAVWQNGTDSKFYHKTIIPSSRKRQLEHNQAICPLQADSNTIKAVLNELKKYLNSSVFVKVNKKGKGSIIIPFGSNKSLNDLIKRIKRED